MDSAVGSIGGILVDHLQPSLQAAAFKLNELHSLASCTRQLEPLGLQVPDSTLWLLSLGDCLSACLCRTSMQCSVTLVCSVFVMTPTPVVSVAALLGAAAGELTVEGYNHKP